MPGVKKGSPKLPAAVKNNMLNKGQSSPLVLVPLRTLPCLAKHEILSAASFATDTAIAQEAGVLDKHSKSMSTQEWQWLVFFSVEEVVRFVKVRKDGKRPKGVAFRSLVRRTRSRRRKRTRPAQHPSYWICDSRVRSPEPCVVGISSAPRSYVLDLQWLRVRQLICAKPSAVSCAENPVKVFLSFVC